jgi:hypothetical protein
MSRASYLKVIGLVAAVTCGAAFSAQAAVIVPTVVGASSSFPGYDASFAVDTGPNAAVTDWASNGQGAGSFLDLNLGQVFTLASANVTDRTTSGGSNGGFVGGTTDFTTRFSIQAFTDSTFSTPLGAELTFDQSTPVNPTSPADFLHTVGLNGLTAQFLQYTVLASNGPNPGLSDISFTEAVPEPGTWAMLLIGFAGLGFLRYRRRKGSSLGSLAA